MQREGLASLFPYRELSVMGFLEVLPHLRSLARRLRETIGDVTANQPAAVVTIDSPGFNFHLARALKNGPSTRQIKRIHYVAPSVWMYKPKRARQTAELFDALLALLPFEPPYFAREGLSTTFVGHPVLWESWQGDASAFRTRHSLSQDAPLLLLLPGSRPGEVRRHLPVFLDAARALPAYSPIILAGPLSREAILAIAPSNVPVADIAEKRDAFAAASLALSKSGTITLELAAAGVPMIVAHRVSPASAWLFRRMALLPYVSLVNIAANTAIVPELLQENCTAARLADALDRLAQPETTRLQREQGQLALQRLRGETFAGPHALAARAVVQCLTRR